MRSWWARIDWSWFLLGWSFVGERKLAFCTTANFWFFYDFGDSFTAAPMNCLLVTVVASPLASNL